MKKQIWKSYFIWIVFSILYLCGTAEAESKVKNEIITAYTYLLSQHIRWDDEVLNQSNYFTIAVLDEDASLYQTLKKELRGMKLFDKPIKVLLLSKASDTDKIFYHLFLVANSSIDKLKKVYEAFPLKRVLISEDAPDMQYTMIDLHENTNRRIKIRLNPATLEAKDIAIDETILLVGGNQIGVSKLYKSSLQKIKKEEEKFQYYKTLNSALQKRLQNNQIAVTKLQRELKQNKEAVIKLQQNMKKLQDEINIKQKESRRQGEIVAQKERKIRKTQKALKKMQAQLNEKELKSTLLQRQIEKVKKLARQKNKQLLLLQQSIEDNKKIVENKLKRVKLLDETIAKQEEQLNKQHIKIEKQSETLLLLSVIVLLTLLFAFYFYFNQKKLKKLAQALKKAKEEAEYANRSKSLFLTNISHELRTPLNAILGFSELLIQNETVQEEHKKRLHTINRSGAFLLSLINDILDIAKIESGKIIIEKQPSNLNYLVDDTVSLMNSRAEEKGLSITIEYDGTVVDCIMLDERKFRQVLLNYLSNAIKYTNKGKIELIIKFDNDTFTLNVKDEGVGLSLEDTKIVFDPFVQVGSASSATGTGLGLAITKEYVKAMGGSVGVTSKKNKGTHFWATIPYENCSESQKQYFASAPKELSKIVSGIKANSKKLYVLIIEDKESNAKLLEDILKVIDCNIEIIYTAVEALEYVKKHNELDIIFTDLRMHKLSTEKVIKDIRTLNKKIPIIGMSASTFDLKMINYNKGQLNEILLKPYRPYEVYDVLKKYFNMHYLYKENSHTRKEKVTMDKEECIDKLSRLDDALLQKLYAQAVLLNRDDMQEVIEEISRVDARLGEMLQKHVDEMNFMDIIENIEEVLK